MTDFYCTDDRIMCDFDWGNDTAKPFPDSNFISDSMDLLIRPSFIRGVSHKRLYATCKRIARIVCDGQIYRIFIDPQNKGAILVIPDMHYDIWFPLGMTVRDVIYHYFGERLILTNDSLYTPISHATFCNITI